MSLREKFADGFETSKEIVLDIPKIVMLGNREMVVENYKGIIEYTPGKITLDANPKGIKVLGNNLEIKSVSQEMLLISGEIENTGFVKEG